MKKYLHTTAMILLAALLVSVFAGCQKSLVCDACGKTFHGTAYTGWTGEETFCEDCATAYWVPLSIENFVKGSSVAGDLQQVESAWAEEESIPAEEPAAAAFQPAPSDGAKGEWELLEDIRSADCLPNEMLYANDLVITQRQTDTSAGTDTVFVTVSASAGDVIAEMAYELDYRYEGGAWILHSAVRDPSGLWEIAMPEKEMVCYDLCDEEDEVVFEGITGFEPNEALDEGVVKAMISVDHEEGTVYAEYCMNYLLGEFGWEHCDDYYQNYMRVEPKNEITEEEILELAADRLSGELDYLRSERGDGSIRYCYLTATESQGDQKTVETYRIMFGFSPTSLDWVLLECEPTDTVAG